jgi:NNP family nitrate/nitrite transporter-like MFS transporter
MMTTEVDPVAVPPEGPGFARALPAILLLTSVFFVNFTSRVLLGPLLPAMEHDLGISHAVIGLFLFMYGLGGFLSQMGASFVIAALDYRRTIIFAFLGQAGAMAGLGLCEPVWIVGLLLMGVSLLGCLYIPAGIALITHLAAPRQWGKAMGIHEMAPNLGLIVAPFLATAFLAFGGWRGAYLIAGTALGLTGLFYLRWGPGRGIRTSRPKLAVIKEIVSKRAFWAVVFLISLGVAVETGVYSLLPLYLVEERGWELAAANYLVGASRIPSILVVLLAGWISDRLGVSLALAMALGLSGASVLVLALGPDSLLIPAVFIQAAAAACVFPPALTAVSALSTPENRSLTISMSLALAPALGAGALPAGIALLAEWASFSLGLALTGVLLIAGLSFLPSLKFAPPE